MSESDDPWSHAKPKAPAKRDKRARAIAARPERAARSDAPRPDRVPRRAGAPVGNVPAPQAHKALRHAPPHDDGAAEHAPRRNVDEVRLYGINACRAAFAARPQDLRKVYLAESRIAQLREVLAWCVKNRLGYRVVQTQDLDKLASSTHHEGVIFDMRRAPQPSLSQLLQSLAAGTQLLLWLDGVGNPHNFGAVLRCAAHFGVAGVLLPRASTLTLSGAATRVAEGGAEAVPVVLLDSNEDALAALQEAGFAIAATLPRGATSIYEAPLPQRLVLVFGAEGEGLPSGLVRAATMQLAIPGSGRVESLNIANAVGVMLGEWWRRCGLSVAGSADAR